MVGWRRMGLIGIALCGLVVLPSCGPRGRAPGMPTPLGNGWRVLRRVPLQGDSSRRAVTPSSGTVIGGQLVLSDTECRCIRLYDRVTGRLLRRIGDSTVFRFPYDLGAWAPGRFAVLDTNSIQVWDTTGRRERVVRVPAVMTALTEGGTGAGVVVAGYLREGTEWKVGPDSLMSVLHDVDQAGQVRRSYRSISIANRGVDARQVYLRNFAVATTDTTVASGIYSADTLWIYDRRTGTETRLPVSYPGYHPPEYPSDSVFEQLPGGSNRARMEYWRRRQILLVRLHALPGARWLVGFQESDTAGVRRHVWVEVGPRGRRTVTGPTSAVAYRTRGDTVWVVDHAAGAWEIQEWLAPRW